MGSLFVVPLVALILVAALSAGASLFGSSAASPPAHGDPWIGVEGNRLVDQNGETVRLIGVNRPGLEYQCVESNEFFAGPTGGASIKAMKSWKINSVRLLLNESCWLGINEVKPSLGGQPYRDAVRGFVQRLQRAGLYVILDLHWAAPGTHTATGLIPMADADHAGEFWRSVAAEYRDDRSIVFDAYNEPHDIDWKCWRQGCDAHDHWFGDYRAAGMSELVEAIRSTGAKQPIMLGGLDWAHDMRGWLAHVPADPANAIVAANHSYGDKACRRQCRAGLVAIAQRYPLVTGELGEKDCRHNYVDSYMRWADRYGISYLGWAWFLADCGSGPALIKSYDGTPTQFGIGFKNHLVELAAKAEG
jgi:aryl-phospho-beta-D-glucosidase BglC (GH1 family)